MFLPQSCLATYSCPTRSKSPYNPAHLSPPGLLPVEHTPTPLPTTLCSILTFRSFQNLPPIAIFIYVGYPVYWRFVSPPRPSRWVWQDSAALTPLSTTLLLSPGWLHIRFFRPVSGAQPTSSILDAVCVCCPYLKCAAAVLPHSSSPLLLGGVSAHRGGCLYCSYLLLLSSPSSPASPQYEFPHQSQEGD